VAGVIARCGRDSRDIANKHCDLPAFVRNVVVPVRADEGVNVDLNARHRVGVTSTAYCAVNVNLIRRGQLSVTFTAASAVVGSGR
jgi:hypothetical protein